MIDAVRNAFRLPDLRRKLLVTLGILVIYRLIAHIPVPGVNRVALQQIFESNAAAGPAEHAFGRRPAELLGHGDGGVSVHHGLHHHPVAQPIIPQLAALMKEGDTGRKKLNQYTVYLTLPLAVLQAFGQTTILAQPTTVGGQVHPGGVRLRTAPLATIAIICDADGRHDARHVAGSAHHRGRHRQRYLDHHLWRDHCGHAAEYPADCRAGRLH